MKIPAKTEHAALAAAKVAAATWPLQEAKNNLSKLVKAAAFEPQFVTVHGKTKAVLMSAEEYLLLRPPKPAKPIRTGADMFNEIRAALAGNFLTDEEADELFKRDKTTYPPKVDFSGDDWADLDQLQTPAHQ